MKNYEKYADEIKEYRRGDFCSEFIKPYILKLDYCSDVACDVCHMRQMLWLLEEYEEPEVDWSKVEVDTPILVREDEDREWNRRYFAKYENETIYAWGGGRTSWNETAVVDWEYAKLAESEEGGVK